MTKSEEHFHKIAAAMPDSKVGHMFGALCIKNNHGKSFVMMWKDELVVKLNKTEGDNVLRLKGTKYFEPMEGRPMKEWIQIPAHYSGQWKGLAEKSFKYVATLVEKEKTKTEKVDKLKG